MFRSLAKLSRNIVDTKMKQPIICIFPRSLTNQDGSQGLHQMNDIKKTSVENDGSYVYQMGMAEHQSTVNEHNGHNLAKLMKVGIRVCRGRDWEWNNQDGFTTKHGDVIREYRLGWIRVKWDNEHINSYRMGANNKYDLELAPIISAHDIDDDEFEVDEEVGPSDLKDFDSNLTQYLLPIYYNRLFPYNLFYDWLSYNNADNGNYFSNREFCFSTVDDKFYRYKSFENAENMKKQILKKLPYKIHLGAVFSDKPRNRQLNPILPLEKELIFDMDINKFDSVRKCCSGSDICFKCWKFIACAIKILERSLREDFGFKHILWVYSGRRGVHCWVCDTKARSLSQSQRMLIANYQLLQSKKFKEYDNVNSNTYQEHVKKSAEITFSYMEKILIDQNLFGDGIGIQKLFGLIHNPNTKRSLTRAIRNCNNSLERWEAVIKIISEEYDEYHSVNLNCAQKISLEFLFPRLDVQVSKHVNHLLKSPFSIHPKTGCICVPFSASNADSFDPTKVPTLSCLTEELDEFDRLNKNNTVPDYKKTSLNESMTHFEEFITTLNKANIGTE